MPHHLTGGMSSWRGYGEQFDTVNVTPVWPTVADTLNRHLHDHLQHPLIPISTVRPQSKMHPYGLTSLHVDSFEAPSQPDSGVLVLNYRAKIPLDVHLIPASLEVSVGNMTKPGRAPNFAPHLTHAQKHSQHRNRMTARLFKSQGQCATRAVGENCINAAALRPETDSSFSLAVFGDARGAVSPVNDTAAHWLESKFRYGFLSFIVLFAYEITKFSADNALDVLSTARLSESEDVTHRIREGEGNQT
ncbi:hypothetical protein PR048_007731 [Dryococelus australis]|uniref:Uncharacterized protein n=1 Tax=Dryococelus australis TaxID=614101 RepID=A0ABQ9HV32_9NEOP|nr:hypothetical protein PR048_007731 [Dryococelus australis]